MRAPAELSAKVNSQTRSRRFAGAAVLVLNLLALYLVVFGVSYTRPLSVDSIQHNRGYAYVVSIVHGWPLAVRSSNIEQPYRADTRVFEDGVLLGPTHLRNDTVRQKGGGTYSHWDERLFFSAADNSDPRTNDRNYVATYTVFLAPGALLIVGLVDIALLSLWVARDAQARQALRASQSDLLRAGVGILAAVVFGIVAGFVAGALFWMSVGGAAVAVLWSGVFLASVAARLRSKTTRRWRWAGETTVIIASCIFGLALAEPWLLYKESRMDVSRTRERLVAALEAQDISVPSDVLGAALARNALLTMPSSFDYRRIREDGPVYGYYWHGALHERDNNGMRRSHPFAARRNGVMRIVVVGDSLTYGVGIAEQATFCRVLEGLLAEQRDVEVLNLGVNGHQSEDVLAVIQNFVPRLDPDLVIYGVSHNDLLPGGLDQRIDASYALPLPSKVKTFFLERSRVLRLAQTAYDKTLLGLGLRQGFYDQIMEQWDTYQARFAEDTKAMNEFVVSRGLPPVVALVLDQNPYLESKGHAVSQHLEKQLRAAGMNVVSSAPFYAAFHGERFPVSKWEGHPNEIINIIWATMLARHLEASHEV